jgi:D-amino-acid oxidase
LIGGTREENDWYPQPRLDTGRAILERALRLMPELIPPNLRDESRPPTVADLEPYIVEHGCGLRPARKGGIRLERDTLTVGADGRQVPVVYNYGYVK